MKQSKTDDLSPEAQRVQARLTREWKIKDQAGQLTLLVAMQALDRLHQAQQILRTEGLVIRDRWNQQRVHPATVIERESRAGLISALKLLNLDLASLEIEDEDEHGTAA